MPPPTAVNLVFCIVHWLRTHIKLNGLIIIIMCLDVLLHISIVQTGVDVLGFLGLANGHLVAGVVAAGFLKHLVLVGAEDGGLGGEGLGQNQGVGAGGDGDF